MNFPNYVRLRIVLPMCLPVLAGCVPGPRADMPDFRKISDIRQLDGAYRNLCLGPDGESRDIYLSQVIWGKDSGLDDSAIDTIEVAADKKVIHVQALAGGDVKRQATYVLGRDVQLKGGRIELATRVEPHADEGGASVAVQHIPLGLDTGNQGLYRRETGGVVLGLFVVPMAVRESFACEFPRLPAHDGISQ